MMPSFIRSIRSSRTSPNVNHDTDSAIEQDNLHTIEKLTHKSVYTLGHQATQNLFRSIYTTNYRRING